MKVKSYPLWVKIGAASAGAVALFAIGIGALVLLINVLDMLGAKVH